MRSRLKGKDAADWHDTDRCRVRPEFGSDRKLIPAAGGYASRIAHLKVTMEEIVLPISNQAWSPDPPDFRDLTLASSYAGTLNRYVGACDQSPTCVDLRDWMPEQDDSVGLWSDSGASAHVCCLVVEYFRRQCEGITERLSRTFVHQLALVLEKKPSQGDVSLRSALKAVRLVGVPPDSLVRHLRSLGKQAVDSPICYKFDAPFASLSYFRVEGGDPNATIVNIRRLLCAGIPCLFGMGLPSSMSIDPRIEVRAPFDSVEGSTAGLICGFDDSYRISSSGAFLLTGNLPKSWGDRGYGWMSYDFVRQRMVTDVWAMITPTWLKQLAEDRAIKIQGESNGTIKEPHGRQAPRAPLGPNRPH